MNGIITDPTYEGWIALCISILRCAPQEVAFEMIDNPKTQRRWTQEDVLEIRELRALGYTWEKIGNMFGLSTSGVRTRYNALSG
ncbi:MAG: hypothetical protein ACI4LK_09125 [Lentihominibacter sp.]